MLIIVWPVNERDAELITGPQVFMCFGTPPDCSIQLPRDSRLKKLT